MGRVKGRVSAKNYGKNYGFSPKKKDGSGENLRKTCFSHKKKDGASFFLGEKGRVMGRVKGRVTPKLNKKLWVSPEKKDGVRDGSVTGLEKW